MIIVFFCAIAAIMAVFIVLAVYSAYRYDKAAKLHPLFRKRDEILSDIKTAQFTLDDKKRELENLQAELAEVTRLVSQKKEVEDFLDKFEDRYAEKKQLMDELTEKIEETEKKLQDVTQLLNDKNAELHSIIEDINDKTLKNSQLDAEWNRVKEAYDHDRNELKTLRDDIDNQRRRLDSLKEAVATKQKELDDLSNKVSERVRRLSEVQSEVAKAEKERVELGTENGRLKAELAENRGKEAYQAKRWEDLDRPVPGFNRKNALGKFNEINSLEEFMDTLKDTQIRFSERTILAFHTGLKTENASPLVVLAGISGTGKSILPQLYSEAFGMNFLSVAVQPRWDSPQDMFGFYNYMQNRYKATELSRMLWQYDIYNNAKARNIYKSADVLPMNIVLLDEMNLARVEYYFSDMLSKLEIRRNIADPGNPSDRSQAEVEIEGGSIGDNESSRRLFVNSNTLFVGTMNEDETTQSLSDKVMDRSNVLRFGKPENINATIDMERFHKHYRNNEDSYMAYGGWKHMCSSETLKSSQEAKLESIILELNNQMMGVGRPFAYRVWNSIKTYVTQYPQLGNTSFDNALADQIEMKILPKLNGLDKSVSKVMMTLESIKSIIEKTHDRDLVKAYVDVLHDESTPFFQWKGVER